jgi:predicted GNAT family acetyltransferase
MQANRAGTSRPVTKGGLSMSEAADAEEVSVREAPAKHRFEIWVGDTLAGFTVYRAAGDRYTFVHTEIDDAFGGRGLASVLIKDTLDDMRSRGISVLPQCPFVRRYVSRHPEYLDLVPAADRATYDLPAAT